MATAVVVGGGVSGLASAYYIQRHLPKIAKVIVLESSGRVGGWVNSTINPDGSIFEHGPRSLRPVGEAGKNTIMLAEQLGLSRDMLPVFHHDDAAKYRFLYVRDNLWALPSSLGGVLTKKPPFSKALARFAMLEPFRKRCADEDESVHSFVSRRFDPEVADIAVDAMCRGIFAGDCRKLGVGACFPPLHQMEKKYGSLFLGALLGPKAPPVPETAMVRQAAKGKWATWSLRYGLQQLTDAMATAVESGKGGEVRTGSPVREMGPGANGRVEVKTDSEVIHADLVFSAVFSKDLAAMLTPDLTSLKQSLQQLNAVDVVVVNLEYNGNILPVKGFGHLLPSSESGPILGVVYDSCMFPQHNRKGRADTTRLSVMMGGSWFQQLLLPDGSLPSGPDLLWMASQAVARHFKVKDRPVRSCVTLQKQCIPQYPVGHTHWVSQLEESVGQSGLPLVLVGNSYRGPAINDCINNARKAVLGLGDRYGQM